MSLQPIDEMSRSSNKGGSPMSSQPHLAGAHNEQPLIEQVFHQLLPEQVVPFANPSNHTLSMYEGVDSPQNTIEVLTANEWKILLALAESYPHYSPYEALFACLTPLSAEQSRLVSL
jgi:hypothetical protein